MRIYSTLLLAFCLLIFATLSYAQYNGFDVEGGLIPKNEILSGGPPRDGIPAIMNPRFESADDAKWLRDSDLVTGVSIGGIERAYPLRILVWHEAVNDSVSGKPVLISYCPLCGSTMVFDRNIGGKVYTFGISGLLHQSDVLFYDRETESLWSQLHMKAVTGAMAGTKFKILPSTLATWKEWKSEHPDTVVLSRNTGYVRDYDNMPYGGYEESSTIMFPVRNTSGRFHPKEKVLVVLLGNEAKAYPFSELEKAETPFNDKLGGSEVVIKFSDGDFVTATSKDGEPLDSFVSYWFAWYTFRPDTLVFEAESSAQVD
jgi:uncharacterized protein DUF3179